MYSDFLVQLEISLTAGSKHLINLLVTTSRTARRLPTFIPVEIIGKREGASSQTLEPAKDIGE